MTFGYAVYFTERAKNRVVRWDPDSGDIDVVAGESSGEPDQRLKRPYGLAFDSGGSLLIADKLNHRICRVVHGRLHPLLLNDFKNSRARRPDSPRHYDPILLCPTALFRQPDGSILCTFADDHTIYRILEDNRIELVLGIPPNRNSFIGPPQETVLPAQVADYPLAVPTGIVCRRDGTILFIERLYQTVRSYVPGGGLSCVFPYSSLLEHMRRKEAPEESPLGAYHPAFPSALALDKEDALYVTEATHGCILRVDLERGTLRKVVQARRSPEQPVMGVSAMTFGPDGTAWVMNAAEGAVQGYAPAPGGLWRLLASLSQVGRDDLVLPPAGSGMVTGR